MPRFNRPLIRFSQVLRSQRSLGVVSLWICDQTVLRRTPGLVSWIRRQGGIVYSVQAGEELKAITNFPAHMAKILRLTQRAPANQMTVVALGGGSVGDFAGFVASVWRRGVPLIQVPTTWLAALDSAHGGKNALNIGTVKNQVGTFHLPREVWITQELLVDQPTELAQEALGELVKMGLIEGRKLWKGLVAKGGRLPAEDIIWQLLRAAIVAKYRVVAQDPVEQSGVRQVLNLGHTLGHVWEGQWGWPHGTAVAQGLYFALAWSRDIGILSAREYEQAYDVLHDQLGLRDFSTCPAEQRRFRLTREKLELALLADKKRRGEGHVRFVFLRGIGRPLIRNVRVSEVVEEAARQGWIR